MLNFRFLLGLALLIFLVAACTQAQRNLFKSSLIGVAECGFYTTVGCAAQATGGCAQPEADWSAPDWASYKDCLVTRGSSCTGSGIARCLFGGLRRAVGGSIIAGGAGCTGEGDLNLVKECSRDSEAETQSEAVQAVAACYRVVCLGESRE